jgi:hypothetical protein
MENKRVKEKGQLLVEASVATGIIVILVISVVTLSLRALNQNRLVSDQVIATNLAAEGYEIAKNILDGNAYKGIAWNANFDSGYYEIDYTDLNLSQGKLVEGRIDNDVMSIFTGSQTSQLLIKDGLYSYDAGGTPTVFKRLVRINNVNGQEIDITSTVLWSTPKKPAGETVSVSGALLGWR